MIFFVLALPIIAITFHKLLMKAIENYEYGGGSFREWREFERQFTYDR